MSMMRYIILFILCPLFFLLYGCSDDNNGFPDKIEFTKGGGVMYASGEESIFVLKDLGKISDFSVKKIDGEMGERVCVVYEEWLRIEGVTLFRKDNKYMFSRLAFSAERNKSGEVRAFIFKGIGVDGDKDVKITIRQQ